MKTFRLFFLDHGGHVFDVDELRAKNDEAAVKIARSIFKCGIGSGYDIWQDNRHVRLELNGSEPTLN